MIAPDLHAGVVAMRPFLPAKDFALSRRFYETVGFRVTPLGDQLAEMRQGEGPSAPTFLLQDYYTKGWAENCMMQLLVRDLDAWWAHIAGERLEEHFGVQAPRAPAMQPWGLRVAYLFDPSGVLWHIAQA